jgi:predicted ArsR family transcriptional regulator
VSARVSTLAQLRSNEGYLAEVAHDDDGTIHLLEHHCPIRNAADHCVHLCDAELELFRAALGPDAQVNREQHLMAGDTRCAYRIELVSKP